MQNLPNPAAPALWGPRVHPGVACSVALDQQPGLTVRLVHRTTRGLSGPLEGMLEPKKKIFFNVEHTTVLTMITVFGLKTQSLANSVSEDCTGSFMLTSNTYPDSGDWCETEATNGSWSP